MDSCEARMKGVSAPAGPGGSRHAGLTGRPWSLLHTAAQPCLPRSWALLPPSPADPRAGQWPPPPPVAAPTSPSPASEPAAGCATNPFLNSRQPAPPASCKPGLTGPGPAFRTQKRAKASSIKHNNNYIPSRQYEYICLS